MAIALARDEAWTAPPDGRPWYSTDDIDPRIHAAMTLDLAWSGFQVIGRLAVDPRSGKLVWQEWRAALGEWVMLTPYRRAGPSNPPIGREPLLWRPNAEYPVPDDALAGLAPANGLRRLEPPAPTPAADVEPARSHGDDWPHPGLALGSGARAAPRTVDEAEARVLRALRLESVLQAPGHRLRVLAADIPREKVQAFLKERDAGLRDSYLPPASGVWAPTPRDRDDYLTAVGWLVAHLSRHDHRLIRRRAANPPYTFRQVAEMDTRLANARHALEVYQRAFKHLFAAVTKAARQQETRP